MISSRSGTLLKLCCYHCIGGKHITIRKRANSGSLQYKYKWVLYHLTAYCRSSHEGEGRGPYQEHNKEKQFQTGSKEATERLSRSADNINPSTQ